MLKTSWPGSAFGTRFRRGSGVEAFFSASTFLNSEVRLIDIFLPKECKPQDERVGWWEVKRQEMLHASGELCIAWKK